MLENSEFLTLFRCWVRRWEGVRRSVYMDTKRIPTIGVGCNLTTAEAKKGLFLLGLDYNAVCSGAVSLTDDQINTLLDHTLNQAIAAAPGVVKNYNSLPRNQKLVVSDLVFNMGPVVFGKFHNTINLIQAGDFPAAAANLRLSAWYSQVGQRGKANTSVLSGELPPEHFL